MEVGWSPMALEHLLKVSGYVENEYGALVAKLSPNVLYYLIDENRVVIAAIVHSKQSLETIREIISEFFKQYK